MPLLVLATVATIIAEPRPPLLGVRPPLRDSRNRHWPTETPNKTT